MKNCDHNQGDDWYLQTTNDSVPQSVTEYHKVLESFEAPCNRLMESIQVDADNGNIHALYIAAWHAIVDNPNLAAEMLDRCARAGMAIAVDNLLGFKNEFQEKLQNCFAEVIKEFPEFIRKQDEMPIYHPALFNEIWRRTYGKSHK